MKIFLLLLVFLPIFTKVHSQCSGTGNINFQRWNNISGGAVSNLTSHANYPNNPTSIGTRNLFEMQQNLGNSIGIKMYGFICPPTTGNYIFWIASDNSGELWLSTSVSPSGKVKIAYNNNSTNSRQWNKFATQKSVTIALTSGQKYYVEALMKDGTGGDNLAVGWAKPGQGTTAPSEVIPGTSLAVDSEAPSAPINLNASALTSTSFTLSWSASTDNVAVSGYDVYRNGVKLNTSNISATTYNISGLSPNTAYTMTVRARDGAANEATSSPLIVTTPPDTQAPTAPGNLRTSNMTMTSFTLLWNASTDNVGVTGYDVYQNGVKINAANITGTSYSITGLAPNTSYTMLVRSKDAAGNEGISNPLAVQTNADTQAPSIPTGLIASAITTSSFTLSWNASTDNVAVTGYDVYNGAIKVNTSNITTTSFAVTGLAPNTSYSMTVRAKDAATNESASTPLSVTTNDIPDTEAPSIPTGLVASAITTSSFTLSWNASTDNVAVTGYDVYNGAIKVNTSNITTTTFNITGLAPNTAYSMTVRAKDAANNESTSAPLSVTTNDIPDTQAPSVPTGLIASAITTSSFTLSWNSSTDNVAVTGYDVYNGAIKVNTADITTTSFAVTGLAPNTSYSMTVRAKDAAGNEGISNPLSVQTSPDTQAPSVPTGLVASAITTSSFTLSWNASTDNLAVTGYDVYNGTLKVNTADITSTTFNITGLSPNTAYSMTVRAKDAAGNEGISNPLTVQTSPDTQAPAIPTGLVASAITTSSFTLSWNASTDNVAVTGYDVYKGAVKVNTADITSSTYNITGLSPNTAYSMTVRAKDAAGNESTSAPLSVTTNAPPDTQAPSVPTGLVASAITTSSFTLSWNASTDNVAVTGYDVYSNGIKINSVLVTGTSYNATGFASSTTFTMTVKAKDAAGNESTSSPLSVTTLTPPPPSPILTLTSSGAKTITSQSNVIIENLKFENITGVAINIFSSNNITIRNCLINRATLEAISIENSNNIIIENCLIIGAEAGVYVLKSQVIKVRNNQFVNMRMRPNESRGQFVQFNEVTGSGNIIENNKGENFAGESNPEDLISLYKSSGLSTSVLTVRNNMFRGGGPSASGSGIVAGDNGGNHVLVDNNTLLDPGQAGIAVAGGRNITISNNKIYARQQPWTNNPLYVWNQSATTCSNITVKTNRVNWTDKNGNINNGWNAGNCSNTSWAYPTTITLAEMNVPAHLITFVTEAELLQLRGGLVQNRQAPGNQVYYSRR